MELAISILHVLVCIFLVLTILLQAGKGASVGAAFGGAGSQTVFGGRGAQTFLSKLTATAAAIFFVTSLALSFSSTAGTGRSVLEGEVAQPAAAPAAEPAPAPADGAAAKPETPPTGIPAPTGAGEAEAVQPAAPAEGQPAAQ